MKKRDTHPVYLFSGLILALFMLQFNDGLVDQSINLGIATPIISLDVQNVTCTGGTNGSITATVTNGTEPYSYLWNTGAMSSSIINLPVGTYSLTVTDATSLSATTSTNVIAESNVMLNVLGFGASCSNICDGAAEAIATSSPPGTLTYLWNTSPPQITATATGLCPGTYTVTVTNENGCTAVESVDINEPAPLTLNVQQINDVSCNGSCDGSATVSVSGGSGNYTFAWSNGQIGVTVTNLCAGSYTVTATDANGCTESTSIMIEEPSPIIITGTVTDVSCNGSCDGSINTNVMGGSPPYTYEWIGPNGFVETANNLVNLCPGTYQVTVTDENNCFATASFTVNEPSSITGSIVNSIDPSCSGSCDGSITVTANGGTPPYTYLWDPSTGSQTTPTVVGICAGTYSVTITDSNGCTLVLSSTLNEPTPLELFINGTNESFPGAGDGSASAMVMGGTPPYTYFWNTNETTSSIDNLSAGTYTLTVTDLNGCTNSGSVIIDAGACNISIELLAEDPLCNGDSNGIISVNVIGGTAPFNYLWSNGMTSAIIDNLSAGTYTVTVTDAVNCADTTMVTLLDPLPINISSAINNPFCANTCDGSIIINPSGGSGTLTSTWSGGLPPGVNQNNLCEGSYTVTVTDQNGCTLAQTFDLVDPAELNVSVTITPTTCGDCNGSIDLSAVGGTPPYIFEWSTGATTEDLSNLCPGNYIITLTDAVGCQITFETTVTETPPLILNLVVTNESGPMAGDGSICAEVSGGTNNYTFLWSNGGMQECITNLNGGNYSVTVTDQNGCSAIDSTSVEVDMCPLSVTVTPLDAFCNGDSTGRAIATIGNGTPPYNINWSSGGSSNPETGLTAGFYQLTVTDDADCSRVVGFTIGEPAPITANITVVQGVSCNGGMDGIASVTPGGGTGPYTFAWSNGGSNSTQNNLAAQGTVKVTDANGCIATFPYQLPEPLPLEVLMNSTPESMLGAMDGTASAMPSGGTPPYTYLWNNAGVSPMITNLSPGTYDVTVTDANACTVTGSVEVNAGGCNLVLASLTITNANCGIDSSGRAEIQVFGGVMPLTYIWSSGGDSNIEENLPPGSYGVTVFDATDCIISTTFEIESELDTQEPIIDPLPSDLDIYLDQQGQAVLLLSDLDAASTDNCGNVSVSLDQSQFDCGDLGSQMLTYSAIDGSGNLSTALFTVTVIDSFPPVVITVDTLVVYLDDGGEASISLADIDLGSQDNCGIDSVFIDRSTFTCADLGMAPLVNLFATDQQGNTAQNSTVVIALDTIPPRMICANDFSVISHCDTVVFYDAAATDNCGVESFNLLSGLPSGSVFSDVVTVVTYEAIDSSGNRDTCSFTVTYIAPPFNAGVVVLKQACPGQADGSLEAQIIEGFLNYSFQWSDPQQQTTAIATDLAAGEYFVTISADGCEIDVLQIELTESPAVDIQVVEVINANSGQDNGSIDVTVTGGLDTLSFTWIRDGMTVGMEEDLSDVMAGNYVLQVIDGNGCEFLSDTILVDEIVSLGNSIAESDIRLAPVPTSERLTIYFSGPAAQQQWQWRLLDVRGQLLAASEEENSGTQWDIYLSNLADGLYYLQLQTEQESVIKKVLVLK